MPSKNLPQSIGRYDVVDRLGQGGMGMVYLGRDPRIGRPVAIKLLRFSDDALRDRFLQEAQSAGSLKHRNIVTIYDYGEHEDQPFIVMEFIEGVTLAEEIRDNRFLPLTRKLQLIEELSIGLDYAHNKGIIHRDVKPANVMVDRDGVLKILDFGIARVSDSSLTQAGMMMGTLAYMSPEQVQGRPVDRRSDIFAVGLVFYELLSYRQAFGREATHLVMNAIIHEAPPPLLQLCPGLDPAIERIVDKALQKDPSRRYQTLAGMAADIANARARVSASEDVSSSQTTVLMRTPVPVVPTPSGPRTPRQGSDRELLSRKRRERIDRHLEAAQKAFDDGDFVAAAEACDQALLLDPDDARVLDLLEAARTALDNEQMREWLGDARIYLDLEDTARASQLVAQVLQIDAASKQARDLQAEIDDLVHRRQQAREREEAIVATLGRARTQLSAGNPESAIRIASEVLGHDPTNGDAHELTRQALAAIEERRQREERDRAARAVVDQQTQVFAAGRWQEAIDALTRFTPPHEAVAAALTEMRAAMAARERRAREEVSEQLSRAANELAAGRLAEARTLVEAVLVLAPEHPEALARRREIQAAIEARDRQEELDRAAGAVVETAFQRFEAGAHADAIAMLESYEPPHPRAARACEELKAKVAAIERRRREADALEQRARQAVAEARRLFASGKTAAAIAALERFDSPHALVSDALASLRVELIAIEERQRQEREEQAAEAARREAAAHEQRARELVARAHQLFASGETASAMTSLERFAPPHPLVSDALATLRVELAVIEERRRQEREEQARREAAEAARRNAEARRLERERWLRAQLAEARSQLEQQPRRAVQILAGLHAIDGDSPDPIELVREIESVMSTARQRVQVQTLVAEARDHLKRKALPAALERVNQALALDSQRADILELRDQIQAAIDAVAREERDAEERRHRAIEEAQARERERQMSAALKRAKKSKSAQEAVAILNDALLLDPTHAGCLELLSIRQAELASRTDALTPRQTVAPSRGDRAPLAVWKSPGAVVAAAVGLVVLLSVWGVVEWRRSSQLTSLSQPPGGNGSAAGAGGGPARGGASAGPAAGNAGDGPARGGARAGPAAGDAGAGPASGGASAGPATGGPSGGRPADGVGSAPAAGRAGGAPAGGGRTAGGAGGGPIVGGATGGRAAGGGGGPVAGGATGRAAGSGGGEPVAGGATGGRAAGGGGGPVAGGATGGRAAGGGAGAEPAPGGAGEGAAAGGTGGGSAAGGAGGGPVSGGTPGGPAAGNASGGRAVGGPGGGPAAGGAAAGGVEGVGPAAGGASAGPAAGGTGGGPGAGRANGVDLRAADEQAIRQVLNQFVAAYNARDAAAIMRLVPTLRAPDFGQVRSYNVVLTGTKITLEGDTATVTCVRQIDQVVTRGNQTFHQASATTFKFRRAAGSWVIDSVS